MSVQLEALADEVFEAASAQARLGAHVTSQPFGEVLTNPAYPDLFFLNGIDRLVAPDWSVEHFEFAAREALPGVRHFRACSRDPKTVAALGIALTAAGYRHEVRVAMVQTFATQLPSVPREVRGGQLRIRSVADDASWSAFEASLEIDSREHGWSPAMTRQYIALSHWRAANTPHRYYLAYDRDRAVAHVGLFQHRATAYLHGLYTRPDARRRGVGSALTLAMTAEAQAMGCDRLTLQCIADAYLPAYYARLGYRAVGEQHLWTKSA